MIDLDEHSLNIFTDGSRRDHPRRGAFAYRYVLIDENGDEDPRDYPSQYTYYGVTNVQMEMMAVIEALKGIFKYDEIKEYLEGCTKIVIYADLQFLRDYYQAAAYQWSNNGWEKAGGGSVLNIKLWKEIIRLRRRLDARFSKKLHIEWVKAHLTGKQKDPHNHAVDQLAYKSANRTNRKMLDLVGFTDVGKKHSESKVKEGCVAMCGQVTQILIVSDKRIRKGLNRYLYRIVSPADNDFDLMDYVNSELILNARYYYEVTFNKNSKNPLILKATVLGTTQVDTIKG